MDKQRYLKTMGNHYIFIKNFDCDFIILLLSVDDMLVIGKNIKKITSLKNELSKFFTMKDLGSVKQIPGMRISRDRQRHDLAISRTVYREGAREILYRQGEAS